MAGIVLRSRQLRPFGTRSGILLIAFLAPFPATPADPHQNPPQTTPALEVARLRSEGVAHYENGIDLGKALAAFEAAAKLQPRSAIETFNLAVTHRKMGNQARAAELLAQTRRLDPSLPHAAYTLGLLHRARGDLESALTQFEIAGGLVPAQAAVHYQLARIHAELNHDAQAVQSLVDTLQLDAQHMGALYQLFLYYQERGDLDRAQRLQEEFTRVRQAQSQSRREPDQDETALARPVVGKAGATRPAATAPKLVFRVAHASDSRSAVALDVRDIDGDRRDDLIVGHRSGLVQVLRNSGENRFVESARFQGDADAPPLQVMGEALIRGRPHRLLLASTAGVYVGKNDLAAAATDALQVSGADASGGVTLADLDHDGDLDMVIGPFEQVLLSAGDGGFRSVEYIAPSARKQLARYREPLLAADFLGRSSIDFVVRAAGSERKLVTDMLGGKHALAEIPVQPAPEGAIWSTTADMDNDGQIDIVTVGSAGLQIDYHRERYRFESTPSTKAAAGSSRTSSASAASLDGAAAVVGDFDNDGWKDVLLLFSGAPSTWWRNLGARRFDARPLPNLLASPPTGPPIAADVDGDGRLDIVTVVRSGAVEILHNESSGLGHALQLDLAGLRSVPSALHAQVEVRRGTFYSMHISDGRSIHLPLGNEHYAEVVRIAWPSGFAESKLNVGGVARVAFREADRISGSCPSIFAWDGQRFRFVTDAFISGPMGVPFGRGYFPVDHDEYIKIPGTLLAPDGKNLRVAITEELREAVFIDQARLLAVDVPKASEMYPNESLLPGVSPEFKLHLAASARPPASAVDHNGRDVTDLVSRIDRRYPTGFDRLQYEGVAQPHWIEFTLPANASRLPNLRLFITGWFHYFESTSLTAVSQRTDLPLDWPHLEVQRDGAWQRLLVVGIPPGKDKTVVVDLAGILPPDAMRLRLTTNLALYWDRILLDTEAAPKESRLHEVSLGNARLRFKGFSAMEPVEPGQGPQPERFDYHTMRFTAPWNPMRGRYTRYGAVSELLQTVDSRMAVFGSGDELLLQFDAQRLPPPPDGWRRDYLLYLDGYVKDGDKYTAHPGQLDPFPYATMRSYPYEASEAAAVFSTPKYQDYLREYQTRAPLRFTGPVLRPGPMRP